MRSTERDVGHRADDEEDTHRRRQKGPIFNGYFLHPADNSTSPITNIRWENV